MASLSRTDRTLSRPALSRATLGAVPEASRPLVVPGDVGAGIVHVGLGAFHRAHQAVYTETAIARDGGDWGIVGVAPRRRELIDTLTTQDGLFSVTSINGAGATTRVVGALAGVRHAPTDPAVVVNLIADPAIRIVTLTVTEKAYRLDPSTGRLSTDDTLRAELAGTTPPASVPGLLVAGLRARAHTDAGPIALVSCDNLPSNGHRLRDAITQAFDLAGSDPNWLQTNVTFPGTMVDRIVPAATTSTLAAAAAALGVHDGAAIAAEPYSEWIIEDDFPAGRPAWESAGAVLTDNAGPYERLKLRALNGVHSALAYLGALAGSETIDEALALPGMRDLLERFIAQDVAPSLTPPDGVSVTAYGASVLDRFANPAIGHRTLQVAMDGSQKLPQRLLHTVADQRKAGSMPRWAALILAAWLRFVTGRADDGSPLPLDDPMASEIRAALGRGGISGVLELGQIFDPALTSDDELRTTVADWHDALARHGVVGVLEGLAGS